MRKNTLHYKERVAKYPDIHTPEQVTTAAHDLEGMKYRPILLMDMPNFLYMNSEELLNELMRLAKMTEEEWTSAGCPEEISFSDFRDKHVGLLFYHYALLYRLRSNEPEAWAEINALYEDD